MSNFLAIATVTAALRRFLQAAVGADVPGATVTTVRPDRLENNPPGAGINVYLFQVTPNAAYRGADLPTRDSDGRLTQRPQVALDLHYLITFYGNEAQLEPQRLLGSTVRTLHGQPVLTRQQVRDTTGDLALAAILGTSDLAEAVDLVKFTPLALSLEELSKVWSVFFQTPYTLSLAYQGSVVLIEGKEAPQPALPVCEPRLLVEPFRQPILRQVQSLDGADRPIVAGGQLLLLGEQLRAEGAQVRLGGAEVAPAELSDTQARVPLTAPPLPAAALRAGVHGVQVIHPRLLGAPPVAHRGAESNVAAFVLRPTLTAVSATNAQVMLTVNPAVGRRQRVVLLLNERAAAPSAHAFAAGERAADVATLSVPISGVRAGSYFVRLQVDGAESPVDFDPASPGFGPTVTIP